MPEFHTPLAPGETMIGLRDRVRAFCESNRILFEQAGQIPLALALFVEDETTRERIKQGLTPSPRS